MSTPEQYQIIADKLAIQELMNEYCLRLEVDDFEQWLDLFTDDQVYEVHRMVLEGREKVKEVLSQAPHGVHVGGALRIELNGDTAETIQNYAFFSDDIDRSNNGWYFRTLVRTDKGWKISRTRVKMQKRARVEAPARA